MNEYISFMFFVIIYLFQSTIMYGHWAGSLRTNHFSNLQTTTKKNVLDINIDGYLRAILTVSSNAMTRPNPTAMLFDSLYLGKQSLISYINNRIVILCFKGASTRTSNCFVQAFHSWATSIFYFIHFIFFHQCFFSSNIRECIFYEVSSRFQLYIWINIPLNVII